MLYIPFNKIASDWFVKPKCWWDFEKSTDYNSKSYSFS